MIYKQSVGHSVGHNFGQWVFLMSHWRLPTSSCTVEEEEILRTVIRVVQIQQVITGKH